MQKEYSLDRNGKIYRVEFYELRGANLQEQFLKQNEKDKLIKNVKIPNMQILKSASKKDKFLGSILVEFE
ncbi:hypothetical protein FSE90_07770 [Campylobacter novaezeelandiae]|nr:hypothetical protein [Campylobacter novaezeelandiae]